MLKDEMDGFIVKSVAAAIGLVSLAGWAYVMWLVVAALRKYVAG